MALSSSHQNVEYDKQFLKCVSKGANIIGHQQRFLFFFLNYLNVELSHISFRLEYWNSKTPTMGMVPSRCPEEKGRSPTLKQIILVDSYTVGRSVVHMELCANNLQHITSPLIYEKSFYQIFDDIRKLALDLISSN